MEAYKVGLLISAAAVLAWLALEVVVYKSNMGRRVSLRRMVICALRGHQAKGVPGTFFYQCSRCWATWNITRDPR